MCTENFSLSDGQNAIQIIDNESTLKKMERWVLREICRSRLGGFSYFNALLPQLLPFLYSPAFPSFTCNLYQQGHDVLLSRLETMNSVFPFYIVAARKPIKKGSCLPCKWLIGKLCTCLAGRQPILLNPGASLAIHTQKLPVKVGTRL